MPSYPVMTQPSANEYSEWEVANDQNTGSYRMCCCDCGLVHDFQFAVMKVEGKPRPGYVELTELDQSQYRVMIRSKRNNRATGQMRRKRVA